MCLLRWRDNMKFTREVHEAYQQASGMARANQAKAKKWGLPMSPVELNIAKVQSQIADRIDLGILSVPTYLIAGVVEQNADSVLLTKDFLPVSLSNSSFAEIWRETYYHCLYADLDNRAISCYEYLGKFYVLNGVMEVSVAKFCKKDTLQARVVRLVPVKADTPEIRWYYDFLRQFRLTQLYQIQFTQTGFFERFQRVFGKSSTATWSDADRQSFLKNWVKFQQAFEKSYGDSLRITAADAFIVLLEKYRFDQLNQMDPWVLARIYQSAWRDLYDLSYSDSNNVKESISITGHLQTA